MTKCQGTFYVAIGALAFAGCSAGEQSIAARVAAQQGRTVATLQIKTEAGGKEGTGIVVEGAKGRILTNWHVVDGIQEGWVRTPGARWMPIVGIVSGDEHKDLALFEVEVGGQALQAARLGSADGVRAGDPVVVIGNPLGEEHSVSDGIVSALRDRDGYRVIQTTAPVSRGNSGGPLFDQNGSVIGVIQSFKPEGENINYAVAIDEARPLLGQSRISNPISRGVSPPSDDFSEPPPVLTIPRLLWLLACMIVLYLFSTYVVFPALIRDPHRHPATAFGITAMMDWCGLALLCAIILSRYPEYLLDRTLYYFPGVLLTALLAAFVLAVVIWLIFRPHSTQQSQP